MSAKSSCNSPSPPPTAQVILEEDSSFIYESITITYENAATDQTSVDRNK